MLLLIDNYDSFTYNLYQYLSELGATVEVVRNDEASVEDCLAMGPERIVVSPGPCTPAEAGISIDLIRAAAGQVPLLGVCLGHQSIGEAFGARVSHAGEIMHGKISTVTHDGQGRLRVAAAAVRGDSLSFTGDRAGLAAGRARGLGAGGERSDHGSPPPHAADRGRPVPPRVDHDGHRPRPASQLPRDGVAAPSGGPGVRREAA